MRKLALKMFLNGSEFEVGWNMTHNHAQLFVVGDGPTLYAGEMKLAKEYLAKAFPEALFKPYNKINWAKMTREQQAAEVSGVDLSIVY